MTSEHALEAVVRGIVNKLTNDEFAAAVAECATSRLSARDIEQVIREYGRTLIEPPVDAYDVLDAVEVRDASAPTWSVRAPLWSREEGQSDLTLELTISQEGDGWSTELDDLHVL